MLGARGAKFKILVISKETEGLVLRLIRNEVFPACLPVA